MLDLILVDNWHSNDRQTILSKEVSPVKKLAAFVLASGIALCTLLAPPSTCAQGQIQASPIVVVAESKFFEAPNNQVQKFSQSINIAPGQDKLNLTMTYFNGTATKPGFNWLRVSSSTMNYFTEKDLGGKKFASINVTGRLSSGGNQITVEAGGVAGSTFAWRLTTQAPSITAVQPVGLTAGDTVTVTGNNFCPDPTAISATVSGAKLTCTSATASKLVFKLPDELRPGDGALRLQVAGLDAGQAQVTVQAFEPTLQGLSAGWVLPGDNLVILGGPFPKTIGNVKVTIGPFDAQVIQSTPGAITVQAPPQFNGNPWGVNQPVKVWINGNPARNQLTVNCYQGVAPIGGI